MIIHYYIKDKKYYKENTIISQEQIKKELGQYRFNKLKRESKCNIRETIEVEGKEEKLKVKCLKQNIRKSKEEKLLNESRKDYILDDHKYGEHNFSLWRRNKKLDHFNFACYIEDNKEETINKAIIEDILNQNKISKEKKNKIVVDEDI